MKSVDFAGTFEGLIEDLSPPPAPLRPAGVRHHFLSVGFPPFCNPSCSNLLQDPQQPSAGLPPGPGCWLLAVPAASFSLQPLQLLGHPGVLQGGPAHPPSKPAGTAWAEDRRKWGPCTWKDQPRRAERWRLNDTCPGP